MNLWQVTAPHFCAGLDESAGLVSDAAPILRWTIGKNIDWLAGYCRRKGWRMASIDGDDPASDQPDPVPAPTPL
jgi:hypothetical protein